MKQYLALGIALLALSGCTTSSITEKGKQVDIVWNVEATSQQCQLKTTLVGSEGSWYNFWLLANDSLVEGALNQLRNQAALVGANTVLLGQPVPYASSVTYIGNAYYCPPTQ
ncbi:DUF4156 domain-containing protein [Photobacterium kagoshimensis]|uniref:DUF4156 domain-containing protein n=1 Tax=Photobacterium kagoshimensis TaxID=2910242 RepID=UPI003D108268